MAGRESLRDIETCLNSHQEKLYHVGFVAMSPGRTLADANERRDWRIFQDFGHVLIRMAQQLYQRESIAVELAQPLYAFDSTTIDLCLSLFPWAEFRKTKAAVKMHTLIDLRGPIPTWVAITTGKVHDVRMLDQLPVAKDAIYTMDRGYVDFTRLYALHQQGAFFVVRAKDNLKSRRLYSRPKNKDAGVRSDQIITLVTQKSKKGYPDRLRRISFIDKERDKRLVFSPTTSKFQQRPSLRSISSGGKWSFSLNGLSSTCGSSRSSEHQSMRSRARYGLPCVSICWSRSPRRSSAFSARSTLFYRFSRSIYSRKNPFLPLVTEALKLNSGTSWDNQPNLFGY